MNTHTTMSAKGQVVIPKATRDRFGLRAGQALEVIETVDGILLKRLPARGSVPFEESLRRIRSIVRYDGPVVSIEEMNDTIREGWIEAASKSDRARD
jgi:AbrB family looped-hinge helix DNA binding protein